ncbi:hypothetical protein DV515_00017658 [Chloebia gouldiae]|uniref:Ig-like domain-containing protein n=1 Tax=Chloebia gouldiae TaxID=44316 RepID=A0A3L8Q9X6_CHLGU|nr:hypothetical protein DV515_00017658 [Chloebia gouldiae]
MNPGPGTFQTFLGTARPSPVEDGIDPDENPWETRTNQNQIPFYPKTGGFLSAPKIPVLGIIGDSVVLPCQVGSRPIPEDFSVRWTFHGQSQRIPVGSYDRKGPREEPDERYRGRAEFFQGELRAGNVSLLLRDVRSSDQGSYGCQVSFQDESREVLLELEVAEVPSVILWWQLLNERNS